MKKKDSDELGHFANVMWDSWLKKQPLEYWMEGDRPISEEDQEKFPLAKKATKLKASKLYNVLK